MSTFMLLTASVIILVLGACETIESTRIFFPGERKAPLCGQKKKEPENLREKQPISCYPVNTTSPSVAGAGGVSTKNTRCSLNKGTVPYKGECVGILSKGPCPMNHIIVLDKVSGQVMCQRRKCRSHEANWPTIGCVPLGYNIGYCPATQIIILNKNGEAECDCSETEIYFAQTNACYPAYTRGPCRAGEIIRVIEYAYKKSRGQCVTTLCPDGMVPLTKNCVAVAQNDRTAFSCYKIGSIGPCALGYLAVDQVTTEIVCSDSAVYSLFDRLRVCNRGSRRDLDGRCRRNLNTMAEMTAGYFAPTLKPGNYSNGQLCPDGYLYTGDICIHLINGTN